MSTLFKLNVSDILKGILLAVLSAVITDIYQALTNVTVIDPKQLLIIGATAGLGYLIKNFFSDDSGKILGKF